MNHPKELDARVINIRLSDGEMAILKKKAADARMTESRFVKNSILYGGAYEIRNFSKEDTKRLTYEINRIGNNLQQIDFWSHNSKEIDEAEWLKLKDLYLGLLGAFWGFVNSREEQCLKKKRRRI